MATKIEACLEKLFSDGFVVIENFLTSHECSAFAKSLDSMIHEDHLIGLRDSRDSYMVHNPMLRDPIFLEILRDSAMTALLSRVLGESFILYAFTTSSLPAGGTNWARRVHVDCPRLIPDYPTNMNVFIPLAPMSQDNGGIELLPRSQWTEQSPTIDEFESKRFIPKLEQGSLLVFYSRLWHSAGVNKSQVARHAITMNFCRSYMRQRFDYPRMITREMMVGLDDRQRQLLGFNVRVPTSLDEYYLPQSERLYKTGQG